MFPRQSLLSITIAINTSYVWINEKINEVRLFIVLQSGVLSFLKMDPTEMKDFCRLLKN